MGADKYITTYKTFGQMKIKKYLDQDYDSIMKIWKSSVKATHHFLSEKDFHFYRQCIPRDFLPNLDVFVVDDHGFKGFMAVSEEHLEMLFVDGKERGKGYGKFLLEYACSELGIRYIDVNEQNQQAVDFYIQKDFKIMSRSEKDAMGKEYPVLHLKKI